MTFNSHTCRSVGAVVLLSTGSLLHAQVLWEYSGAEDFQRSFAWWVDELDPGVYVANIEEITPGGPSVVHHVVYPEDGPHYDLEILTEEGWWHRGVRVHTDQIHQRRHLLGIVMDSLGPAGAQLGLFHSITTMDHQLISSALHQIAPQARFVSGTSCLLSNGDLIYVAGMNTENHPDLRDKLLFVKLDAQGMEPIVRIHEGDLFSVKDVDEDPAGIRVTFSGESGLTPPGYGKIAYFNGDLDFLDALVMPNANGFAYSPGQDTAFTIYGSERSEDGGLLVNCESVIAFNGNERKAFLAKVNDLGELVGSFVPPAPAPNTYSRVITTGLTALADGNFLWGYEENDDLSAPSRVHVYKLTAALDVLGHVVLDENQSGHHFWPVSLRATSGGEALIAGVRIERENGQPNSHAYVAKLGGFTHIGEEAAPALDVVAYPNPGQNLRIAVNDAILQNATVQLFDATGRVVAKTPLHYNQAYLDCNALGTGLYGYRIVDAFGMVRASGKWVRE